MDSPRITRSQVGKMRVREAADISGGIMNEESAAQRTPESQKVPKSEIEDDEDTIICANDGPDQTQSVPVPVPVVVTVSEPVTPVTQIVKRKRGRPRKHPESGVTTKKLKFQLKDGTVASDTTPGSSVSEMVFPVTPYPGKTGSMSRVPRPPNAFMIFGKENRKRLSLLNPGSTNKDISRLLGQEWKSMDDSEKAEYRLSARKALLEHKLKYPNYQYVPTEARIRKKNKAAAKAAAEQLRHLQRELTVSDPVKTEPLADESVANKENIPPADAPADAPAEKKGQETRRVITELFVAPPGYEDVEIVGLDKFVLWENKLIPYREWLGAEGDVKRLSGTYTQVPEQLLQPITNCVIAGSHLDSPTVPMRPCHEGQRDSGEVVNTMVWRQSDEHMTLNECNAGSGSEADKSVAELEKSGSEMDAQRLLQDLMTDSRAGGGEAPVVVMNEPPAPTSSSRRLFWNTSDDDE